MKCVHEDSMLLKENAKCSKRAYGSRARIILMKSETATVSIRKWRFQSTRGDHLRIATVAVSDFIRILRAREPYARFEKFIFSFSSMESSCTHFISS